MKFSIITPVFNAEHTISDTIKSVLNLPENLLHEYIIVDGQSTDNTTAIIKGYSDTRIRLISEPDDGIYDAMNKGVQTATGDIVGIINADDYYHAENIGFVDQTFVDRPDVEIVHGRMTLSSEGHSKTKTPDRTLKGRFGMNPQMYHPTLFVRRTTYERVGLYNQKYKIAADQDFYFRARDFGAREVFLDRNLALMRAGGVGSGRFSSGLELLDIQHSRRSFDGFISSINIYRNRRIRQSSMTPNGRLQYFLWALKDFIQRKLSFNK